MHDNTTPITNPSDISPVEQDAFDHSATYSPEDNKIRIYPAYRLSDVGYKTIKAAGYMWAPKQELFVCPRWTPEAEDAALELCGDIGDEAQPRIERAAQRAERFENYRDKREGEALSGADRYESGPTIHGHQSEARAMRSARRHDLFARNACTQWSKAEYWQHRTAGVIQHAQYIERVDVRMRRIKGLEADLRRHEKEQAKRINTYNFWISVRNMGETAEATALATRYAGVASYYSSYQHPNNPNRRESSLWDLLRVDQPAEDRITGAQAAMLWLEGRSDPSTTTSRWMDHYKLRLEYERAMLAAQGGTGADVSMQPGGWIGTAQIQKVSKDRAGRISKVYVLSPDHLRHGLPRLMPLRAERIKPQSYRAPNAEELAVFEQANLTKKADKTKAPPLINPTPDAARRLMADWNAVGLAEYEQKKRYSPYVPSEIRYMEQRIYSENSGGTYSTCETVNLGKDGRILTSHKLSLVNVVCRIRVCHSGGDCWFSPKRIIVLTDKPQVELPDFSTLAIQESVGTPIAQGSTP